MLRIFLLLFPLSFIFQATAYGFSGHQVAISIPVQVNVAHSHFDNQCDAGARHPFIELTADSLLPLGSVALNLSCLNFSGQDVYLQIPRTASFVSAQDPNAKIGVNIDFNSDLNLAQLKAIDSSRTELIGSSYRSSVNVAVDL